MARKIFIGRFDNATVKIALSNDNYINVRKLEKTIAKFHQREDAILYAACFDANAGVFEVLLSWQFFLSICLI